MILAAAFVFPAKASASASASLPSSSSSFLASSASCLSLNVTGTDGYPPSSGGVNCFPAGNFDAFLVPLPAFLPLASAKLPPASRLAFSSFSAVSSSVSPGFLPNLNALYFLIHALAASLSYSLPSIGGSSVFASSFYTRFYL